MAHIRARPLLSALLSAICACAAGEDLLEADTVRGIGTAHDGAGSTSGGDPTGAIDEGDSSDGAVPEDTTGGLDAEGSTGALDASGDESSSGSPEPIGTDTGTHVEGSPVDLSGWTLLQTSSDRTFVLPEGTIVPAGGWVVVGRASDRAAFESFWGVSLGDEVIYIDAENHFPVINGGETFRLVDPDDLVVDGPTPVLLEHQNLQRVDATNAASSVDAWSISNNPNAHATPGVSPKLEASDVAYISEVSDVLGVGLWVYEFVEVHAPG